MTREYVVYRFKDFHDNIVYVGKSKTGIKNRFNQHFNGNGHLKEEWYDEVYRVEYITLKSKTEMDIKEIYYISKWKPQFNTVHVYDEELSVKIDEDDEWETYWKRTTENEMRLLKKVSELEKENIALVNENNKIKFNYEAMKESLNKELEIIKENESEILKDSYLLKIIDIELLYKNDYNYEFTFKYGINRDKKLKVFNYEGKKAYIHPKRNIICSELINQFDYIEYAIAFQVNEYLEFEGSYTDYIEIKQIVDKLKEKKRVYDFKNGYVREFLRAVSIEEEHEIISLINNAYGEWAHLDLSIIYDEMIENDINKLSDLHTYISDKNKDMVA